MYNLFFESYFNFFMGFGFGVSKFIAIQKNQQNAGFSNIIFNSSFVKINYSL